MTAHEVPCVVTASCEVAADSETIFALIADPANQPRGDGNDNLASRRPGTSGDGSSSRSTRATTAENLQASLDRLTTVVEGAP
jgi:hypothetical protein